MVHALECGVHQAFGSSQNGTPRARLVLGRDRVAIPDVEDRPADAAVPQCFIQCRWSTIGAREMFTSTACAGIRGSGAASMSPVVAGVSGQARTR